MGKVLKARAYCWASGEIEVAAPGEELPEGTIVFAAHEDEGLLRDRIRVVARRGYEEGLLLVPGVPEAMDGDAAVDALLAFADWAFPEGSPMYCRAASSNLMGKVA